MKRTLHRISALVLGTLALNFSAKAQTYCTPANNGDCSQQVITNFAIGGTTLSNPSTCPGGTKYTLYPATGSTTASLMPGTTYTLTLGSGSNGNPAQFAIWGDYNHNGTFESSEFTLLSTTVPSPGSTTVSYTVPSGALSGATRLRLRSNWQLSPIMTGADACATLDYGETEDYVVTIGTLTPCSGTPAAAISGSVTSACAGVPFNLTATPSGTSGLTYQFQYSTDGGVIWNNLGTASTSPFYTVPTQTVTTKYRVLVTCSGGGTGTSTAITITQNAPSDCYCIPTTTGGTTYYITNFTTTGGVTNINNTSGSSATGYQDFHTTASASAAPGTTINYSISVAGGSTYGRAIWIDFNSDGVFQSSEQVASSTSYLFPPLTGSFTIPGTATTGTKRMRVLASYTPSDPSNPCTNTGTGEYEDYSFTVLTPPPCTGTPTAGTATTPLPTAYCMSAPVKKLTLSGYTTAVSGIGIIWQSSTDGVSFSDVPGATADTFNTSAATVTMYYRAKVSCSGSGLNAFSNVDTIVVNNPTPTATPASTTICSGTSTNVTLSSATPGVTFSWGVPTISGGTVTGADSGSGNVINQTLVNTGTTPVTVTYTVTGSIGTSGTLIYTYDGVSGASPTTAQCTGWDAYRASLLPSYTYSYVNLKGTNDMVGRTISDPVVASNLAAALRTATGGDFTSGGYTWRVGIDCGSGCGGGVVELSANGDNCACASPGYSIRPNLINSNWGGVNTATCSGPSQTIYVTFGYDGTCTATTTVTITVNPSPAITAQPVDVSACEGQPFTLSVTSPTGTAYQWYKGSSPITGATSATYADASAAPADAGDYFVLINGCTSSDTVSVVVGSPMVVNLGADTTICAGDVVLLDAGNPGATYDWSTGDNTQTIVVNSAGTYSVSVSNSACTATDTIVFSEVPVPVAGSITVGGTAPAYTFSASATGATTSSWLFGDGGSAAGTAASHTYTANGVYEVMFIAGNECGQNDTSTTTVTITGLGVGAVNGTAANVQVYPNPSNGLTVVEAKGALISNIEVMDNLGRVVLHTTPNTAKTVIDVKGMAQGIYTLRIHTNKGISTVKLVVKD